MITERKNLFHSSNGHLTVALCHIVKIQHVNNVLKTTANRSTVFVFQVLNSGFDRVSVEVPSSFFFLPLSENCKKSNVQRLFFLLSVCACLCHLWKTKTSQCLFKPIFFFKTRSHISVPYNHPAIWTLTLCRSDQLFASGQSVSWYLVKSKIYLT